MWQGAIGERDQLTFPEAFARHVEVDVCALRASSSDEKSVLMGCSPPDYVLVCAPGWSDLSVTQRDT
jgi:hypothetical protein